MTKMVWTPLMPLQNVKSCILSRPPAVVFALCVASFALVTLGLAVYVKHTSSPLSDPDELSWNDVATKFNRLKFCTYPIESMLNTSGMVSVAVPYDMALPIAAVWSNYSLISGTVSAHDLGFYDFPGTNLSFSFSLMQRQNRICLNLYHPPTMILPEMINTCNALQFNPLPKSIGAFVLPREEKRPSVTTLRCSEASAIPFDLKLQPNEEWTVLLTEDDRDLVSVHLLATSAFLFTCFLMMLCFAAVRGAGQRMRAKSIPTSPVGVRASRDQTSDERVDDKDPLQP